MMSIAKSIILPIIFSIIIAIVLHPIVDLFVKIKIPRVLAIIITLFITLILMTGIGAFIISQLSRLSESWPKLVENFTQILNNVLTWASGYFDISPQKIHVWIIETKNDLINTSSDAIGRTILTVGNGVVLLLLMPVYIFMILFYQPLLLEFFKRVFGVNNRSEVSEIITQIKTLIQQYLTGLVIEMIIVAILNSVGLLLLGIDYAILFGIIGAILNVIPYLGGIISVALPMLFAFATKSSPWYALYVLAVYYFIQLVDNNYIVPKIVASKVKINALVSIIVVLAFGAFWGIPGMFISIPITAIVKLIFDHIEPLKPWGFLLGDTMPTFIKIKNILPKKNKKK